MTSSIDTAASTGAVTFAYATAVAVALVQRAVPEPPLAALAVVAAAVLLAALAMLMGPSLRWVASSAPAERLIRAVDVALLVLLLAGAAAALLLSALFGGALPALVLAPAAGGAVVVLVAARSARGARVPTAGLVPARSLALLRLRRGRRAACLAALVGVIVVQVVLFLGPDRPDAAERAAAAAWAVAAPCGAAAVPLAITWAVLAVGARRTAGRDAWQRRRVRAIVLGGSDRPAPRPEDLEEVRGFEIEVQPSLEACRDFWALAMAGFALLLLGGALRDPADLPDRVWLALEALLLPLFRAQAIVLLRRARESALAHLREEAAAAPPSLGA